MDADDKVDVESSVDVGVPEASAGSNAPLFSVVVPTYDRAATLPRVVSSVLDQTEPDFELVVVDDGSHDETPAVCTAIRDPRASVIRQENRGLAGARNTGAGAARGQYLVFLDDDDEALPNMLATFAGPARAAEPAVVWGAGEICTPGSDTPGDDDCRVASAVALGPVFDGARGVLLAGSFAVRRDAFVASQGFTEGLASSELSEFLMRLLPMCTRNGWAVEVFDDVVVRINQEAPGKRPLRAPRPLLEAMTYVIDTHEQQLARSPGYLANCLGVAGVSLARLGRYHEARARFVRAALVDPRNRRHVARALAASVPPIARRVWPPYVADGERSRA